MSAERPERRNGTAREIAARLGVSPRTVRRIAAEPRAEFERRAKERRAQAAALRAEKLTWAQVGERMGVSASAARKLADRAEKPADD